MGPVVDSNDKPLHTQCCYSARANGCFDRLSTGVQRGVGAGAKADGGGGGGVGDGDYQRIGSGLADGACVGMGCHPLRGIACGAVGNISPFRFLLAVKCQDHPHAGRQATVVTLLRTMRRADRVLRHWRSIPLLAWAERRFRRSPHSPATRRKTFRAGIDI